MSGAALGAGAVGILVMLVIRVAGGLAGRRRTLLVVFFAPGLYLTAVLYGVYWINAAVSWFWWRGLHAVAVRAP